MMSNLSSSNEENSSSILESKSSKSKSISKEVQNTEKESEYSLKDPNNPSSKSEIKKNQSEDNSKEENGERSCEDNCLVKILKNIDPILKSHQRNKIVEELAKLFINTYREIFKDSDEATFQEDAKKITTQLYNKLLNKGENEIISEKEENKDFDDEKEEESDQESISNLDDNISDSSDSSDSVKSYHSLNSYDSYEISNLEDESFKEIKNRIKNLGLKYQVEKCSDGSIRFMIIKNSYDLICKVKKISASKDLEHQLNQLQYDFVTITKSSITIRVKFSNLWIKVIKAMLLKPIPGKIIYIKLDFANHSCIKFAKEFAKLFKPLSKSGSKILVVRLFKRKKDYDSYNHNEILRATKLLKKFNIDKVQANNWIISADLFYLLLRVKKCAFFEFQNCVLCDTTEKEFSELGRMNTKTVVFENCRYIDEPFHALEYMEFDKLKNNKGTEFLTNFLKIRGLYQYLKKLRIQSSFGFYEAEYNNQELCELLKQACDDKNVMHAFLESNPRQLKSDRFGISILINGKTHYICLNSCADNEMKKNKIYFVNSFGKSSNKYESNSWSTTQTFIPNWMSVVRLETDNNCGYWIIEAEQQKYIFLDENSGSVNIYDEYGLIHLFYLKNFEESVTFTFIKLHEGDPMNRVMCEDGKSVEKLTKSKSNSKNDRERIKKYEPSFLYKILRTIINYGGKVKDIIVKGGINGDIDVFQEVVNYLDDSYLKDKEAGAERSTSIQVNTPKNIVDDDLSIQLTVCTAKDTGEDEYIDRSLFIEEDEVRLNSITEIIPFYCSEIDLSELDLSLTK